MNTITKYINYITVNNKILYNLKDFCNAYNLPFQNVKESLKNRYCEIKTDSETKFDVLVDDELIWEIIQKYSISQETDVYKFAQTARHNFSFSECSLNRGKTTNYCSELNV